MTFDRTQQLQLDLIALRAQEDRQVTEAVLRQDWDGAATIAKRAQRVTAAIERMLTTGRPFPDAQHITALDNGRDPGADT